MRVAKFAETSVTTNRHGVIFQNVCLQNEMFERQYFAMYSDNIIWCKSVVNKRGERCDYDLNLVSVLNSCKSITSLPCERQSDVQTRNNIVTSELISNHPSRDVTNKTCKTTSRSVNGSTHHSYVM
jgi:hypothetical protein